VLVVVYGWSYSGSMSYVVPFGVRWVSIVVVNRKSMRWPGNHVKPCSKNALVGLLVDEVEAALAPWVDTLESRDRDALNRLPPESHNHIVINLGQTKGRQGETAVNGKIAVNCITPTGCEWLLKRNRPLLGIEKCALQGIPISGETAELFSQPFCADLAGNGFCTPVVTQIVMSMLTVFGRSLDPSILGSTSSNNGLAPHGDAAAADLCDAGPAEDEAAASGLHDSGTMDLDLLSDLLSEGLL
jgi:hypothetical protein